MFSFYDKYLWPEANSRDNRDIGIIIIIIIIIKRDVTAACTLSPFSNKLPTRRKPFEKPLTLFISSLRRTFHTCRSQSLADRNRKT